MASFTIAAIKNQIDEVRAQVYPRNETEKKVYEAVSSKNWGASTTLMVYDNTIYFKIIF
jgi:Fe-S cluster biosynthesis and repair protein YggX